MMDLKAKVVIPVSNAKTKFLDHVQMEATAH